jgi:hypothetical protein
MWRRGGGHAGDRRVGAAVVNRAAAVAALALATASNATERARRDVAVIEAGHQVASFDLPAGDAICVRAHVTEEDPGAATWHLTGHVELRVTSAGRAVFTFAARELILQKAAVERLGRPARDAPAAGVAVLTPCGGPREASAASADD